MLPSPLTIVDVETTGLSPTRDRIIEIGLLRIENQKIVSTYQSLINPEMYVSPQISNITGISYKDLEHAPLFEDVAQNIQELFSDSIFVAHNARFDYGFIKQEFRRLGSSFQAKQLCTVKLSQALFPRFSHHNLDALCERFHIVCQSRHRAFADAQVLWDFLVLLQKKFPEELIEKAAKLLLQKPSLPPHLSPNQLTNIPSGPGVYIFYGKDGAPLYVGKSKHVKERILSHFSQDYTSGKEMQISQQIYSIETITASGELEALIKEAFLVKKLQPLFNRKLRQSRKMVILRKQISNQGYFGVSLAEEGYIDPDSVEEIIGIFKSKRQAREYLLFLAKEYKLCRKLLGLEKTRTACFGYRLESCTGACVQSISPARYNMLCIEAFLKNQVKRWPFPGPVVIREIDEERNAEGGYIVDKWCILGEWKIGIDLTDLLQNPQYVFDVDTYKILISYLMDKKHLAKISVLPFSQKQVKQKVAMYHMSHEREPKQRETVKIRLDF